MVRLSLALVFVTIEAKKDLACDVYRQGSGFRVYKGFRSYKGLGFRGMS